MIYQRREENNVIIYSTKSSRWPYLPGWFSLLILSPFILAGLVLLAKSIFPYLSLFFAFIPAAAIGLLIIFTILAGMEKIRMRREILRGSKTTFQKNADGFWETRIEK